jgi:preprotein translocase subunit SecD
MIRVIGWSSLLFLATQGLAQGTGAHHSIIQLRLARERPESGFVLTKSTADSNLYVAPLVIVDDADIVQARTTSTTDGCVLTIRLRPAAATRLHEVTKAHIGERLAVFINEQLNGAGVIREPLHIGVERPVNVAVHLPKVAADEFAAAVAARWPATH